VRGFELGAVDYITKPFNSAELLARVNTHVMLKKMIEINNHISNERKELLHILCHDLTNPIGFVSSVLDMNKENPSMLEQMKENIEKSMLSSLEIIKLVRMIMAIEEEKIDLKTSLFDLRELINESLDMMNIKAKNKNIRFDVDIPEGQKARVEKTSFVNSVINNALTNAMKFSETGGTITIKAKEENGKVVLTVKDNGIGMSENLLHDLFDIKKKTSRKGTAGEAGTGFGMPLMMKFVKNYEGEIRVTSREKSAGEDHGTEIIMTLNSR